MPEVDTGNLRGDLVAVVLRHRRPHRQHAPPTSSAAWSPRCTATPSSPRSSAPDVIGPKIDADRSALRAGPRPRRDPPPTSTSTCSPRPWPGSCCTAASCSGEPARPRTLITRVIDQIILPAATSRSAAATATTTHRRTAMTRPSTTTQTRPATSHRPGQQRHLGWALVLISHRPADGGARRHHRQHRPALHPGRPRHLQANLPWVVTGYALAFGGLLLLGGRLGDLYGRRRIFMVGLVDLRRRLAARRPRARRGPCCSAPAASRASAPRSPPPPRWR